MLIEKFNGRALLADQMGLGKTIQSLLWAYRNPDVRPIVIVCPASLKFNWEREASKHFGMVSEILNGTKPPKLGLTASHQIVIINYDILVYWLAFLRALEPKLVIIDECHYGKSLKSIRSRSLQKLCKGVPHVIALSGTPITNRPAELWPTLHILRPDKFPSFLPYGQEFCDPQLTPWGWRYNGATNLKRLNKRLRKLCMIRRLKSEVIEQLPPKIRSVIPIALSPADRKEYNHAFNDFIGWLSQYDKTKATRAARAERLVKWGYLKRLSSQLKMKGVLEWIDNFLKESQSKLILFAVHKDVVSTLYERYKPISVKVDGSVNKEHRKNAVDAFQHNRKIKIFIGNIRAAGVGLNLTAADTVAFVELSWTPGEHSQAEDRAWARVNDMHGCNVFYLIANDTIEVKLMDLIDKKQKVLDEVLDGKRGASGFELMDLLEDQLLGELERKKK